MSKAWIIARHEFIVNVRRPAYIIFTLAVPILGVLGLIVAAFFGGHAMNFLEDQLVADDDKKTGIVDESGLFTPMQPNFAQDFQSFADAQLGRAALRADEISSLAIIPADYLETGEIKVVTGDNGFQAAAMEESGKMRRFLVAHLIRDSVSPDIEVRVADPITPVLVSLDDEGGEGGGLAGMMFSLMVPYLMGLLLVMTIFMSANYLLRGVAQEKSSRIIEIILSSVTARELLAGKVIGLGALGLLQVVVWLATTLVISSGAMSMLGAVAPLLSRPEVFVLGLVYYLLGFVMYAVLMGSVGALGSDMRESQQLAGYFSLTAFLPLMLGGFLFTNPNAPVARALSWFPLTAPTMMMLRLPMTEVPLIDIIASLILIGLTIPLILWLGAKVFRVGLLMYGKRPSFRELWAAVRQA
jgi:ABC-2 type transport system permease protein